MLSVLLAWRAGFELSVTRTVKVNVPMVVGFPEIFPVDEASLRPGGRLPPVVDHVYGVVPPVAASVAE